ncbi:hypothetical protein [Chitinivorax sp. B]|uniref:hypothetical protein n=1 Tax=Chitinivorax sp. B TaxID=2502235 RepID=UPI0010F9A9AB|nr:hypothetical protein [Chitinivorax sp. B]
MKRFDTTLYAVSLTAGMAMIGLNLLSAYEAVEYKPESVRLAEQADNVAPVHPIEVAQPAVAPQLSGVVDEKSRKTAVVALEKTVKPGKEIAVETPQTHSGDFVVVGNGDSWTKK